MEAAPNDAGKADVEKLTPEDDSSRKPDMKEARNRAQGKAPKIAARADVEQPEPSIQNRAQVPTDGSTIPSKVMVST